MARPVLPTDFKDDVLAESMSGKRRYRIIQNADGTVSLDDVTDYEQVGSVFGAKQVNDMSSAVNSIEDVKAANNCTTTEPGFVLDARQGKTLMDKSNELSRDFQNKMDKYYGAATLSIVDESSVLKYLILDADLIHHSHEISFSVIVNNLYFYSGIMYTDGGTTAWGQIQQRNAGNNAGNLFSFYFERGADPVLKKLGSAPADMLIKATNTTYKATEEEDVLVIWEHSGRCRTQKHPTPHSTFTIIAAGITKVTSVLKGNGGDYQYSAAGNYFVQHLSAGQTITCSLSEDDFSSRYRMYVIKATL